MAKSKYVSPYGIALVYAALGERRKAFDWLKKAAEEQAAWVIYLNVDPKLDSLRSDPRLEELARSIGLSR